MYILFHLYLIYFIIKFTQKNYEKIHKSLLNLSIYKLYYPVEHNLIISLPLLQIIYYMFFFFSLSPLLQIIYYMLIILGWSFSRLLFNFFILFDFVSFVFPSFPFDFKLKIVEIKLQIQKIILPSYTITQL